MRIKAVTRIRNAASNIVRRTSNAVLDQVDLLTGRRDEFTPPRNLEFVGTGDFKKIGEWFLRHFIDAGGLKPDARTLDVGSGVGRLAIPMTRYLSGAGEYWGIEIVEKGVAWCRERITSKFPNFHFVHADVYNKMYNPKGRHQAATYRFPFPGGHFDFVFLTSVFTHMFPADVENYLSEISRVLRSGGRCYATFFIMNDEARDLVRSGAAALTFPYAGEGYLAYDKDVHEGAVAYEESWVRQVHEAKGLRISDPVYYGHWSGRKECPNIQDIVISEKIAKTTA